MIVATGIDLVEIARIGEAIAAHGDRFVERIYLPRERSYCESRPNPTQHFAVRFAAKEAVLKVLRTGYGSGLGFRDVEVDRGDDGVPHVALSPAASRQAAVLGIGRILVSLSHTGTLAVAHAIGVGTAPA